VHGAGTEWLAGVRQGEQLDLVGPLGTPFRLPTAPVGCVLVGGGYGSAPLFGLAEALGARDCRVDMVIGAATADRVFGELEAKRTASAAVVTTEDGSTGVQGMVSDVLPDVIERSGARVVYACGPMAMLRAVGQVAASYRMPCQVAVEEAMACGIGVCMTCVLPVVGDDGVTRMTRSCVDGPVFMADRVRFDDVGTVPADALGAPATAGALR
jgi:dihydroorotate dehydrogenase electron transfer subunit